uniref:Uncharacterized protein n=1 Tax=Panagrolaimus sp. PS1159 TaxID=55785 RepID=A0AC35EXH2_9BILA
MVEKMEVDETVLQKETKKEEPSKADLNAITYENLNDWCAQLERGENIIGRVIQFLSKTRKELNVDILTKLITTFISDKSQRDSLLGYIGSTGITAPATPTPMEVDKTKPAGARSPRPERRLPTTPSKGGNAEAELYVQLLTMLYLVDQGKLDNVDACIKNYIAKIDQYEKRSLDPFLAKGFFYMTLVAERRNEISHLRG